MLTSVHQVALVIGKGGESIKAMQSMSGARIVVCTLVTTLEGIFILD